MKMGLVSEVDLEEDDLGKMVHSKIAVKKTAKDPLTSMIRSRDTGMALVLICLLLLLTGQHTWLLGTAIIFLVVTMTRPQLFAPVSGLWFGMTRFLGAVVSFAVLT